MSQLASLTIMFAAYHLALEPSLLADEGASLPELPLKSPITVALPDKSSTINRSISTIPGFTISSSGKPQSNSAEQASSKSDPNSEFGNVQDTGSVASPFSSENHTSQASISVSTSVTASVDMHDLPVDKGTAPSSFFGDSSCHIREENKTDLLKGDVTGSAENNNETILHCPVPTSSFLDRIETFGSGRRMACDMQTDDIKIKEMQHGFSGLGTSHQDNPRNDQMIPKEEFPPSPSDHQSILVALSSWCVWKETWCEHSHMLHIKYYLSFDKPLGRYLRDHLFDQGLSTFLWCFCFPSILLITCNNNSCSYSYADVSLNMSRSGEMVACFKYASINVQSVYLPPSKLDFNGQHQEWVQEEANKVNKIADHLFAAVHTSLHQVEEKILNTGFHDDDKKSLNQEET